MRLHMQALAHAPPTPQLSMFACTCKHSHTHRPHLSSAHTPTHASTHTRTAHTSGLLARICASMLESARSADAKAAGETKEPSGLMCASAAATPLAAVGAPLRWAAWGAAVIICTDGFTMEEDRCTKANMQVSTKKAKSQHWPLRNLCCTACVITYAADNTTRAKQTSGHLLKHSLQLHRRETGVPCSGAVNYAWDGSPTVWWHGGMVAWWHGGMVVWWYVGMVVWWHGGMVVWWYGGMVAWWYGGHRWGIP